MAHLVITIGCEYGAKGNQIGRKVAEDLGIKFYDRDTVDQIIKEVGIPKTKHLTETYNNLRRNGINCSHYLFCH